MLLVHFEKNGYNKDERAAGCTGVKGEFWTVTLIEFYDSEPIKNVMAAMALHPEHVVYICDRKMMSDRRREAVKLLLERRGLDTTVNFYNVNASNPKAIREILERSRRLFDDCVVDFTGGRELMLLEAGIFCKEHHLRGFYIDLQNDRFIDVFGCRELAAQFRWPSFYVEDMLCASGASMEGYGHYLPDLTEPGMERDIDAVFRLILEHSGGWAGMVSFLQQAVKPMNERGGLEVDCPDTLEVHPRLTVRCDSRLLSLLSDTGAVTRLEAKPGRVRFRFKNEAMKKCLPNHGIWLELFACQTAKRLEYFDDVRNSVVIDWDGAYVDFCDAKNEVDLLLIRGVKPVFVSCKMGVPSPLALSEIRLLSSRFGGTLSKTVLLTAAEVVRSNPSIYKRAKELGIAVIDQTDLKNERLGELLLSVAENNFRYRL